MVSIIQMIREACADSANVAKAREAFALLHTYSDNAPRLPGCGTVERMAVRIHSGWSVEQTAAREYAYRWHLPLGQWVNHAESRSRSRQCCGARVEFNHAAPELDNMNRPKASRVTVKSGRGRYQLGALPRDDFPAMVLSAEASPIAFALPAAQFLADLAALASCASKEESRYYLNGAALQVRELAGQERLCLVATDGNAIAVASRPIPIGATDLADMILPSKTMAIIGHAAKLAGDADAVRVTAYGTNLAFDFGAVRIVSKTIDGTYPDWERQQVWDALAPTDASPALFPELLPGAPVATIDKIAKAAKGLAIDWQPARQGMVGTVASDDGLLFGAMNVAHADACQRKGFEYRWNGGSEAQAYLVALAESRGLPSAVEIEAHSKAMEGDAYSHFEGARIIQRGDRIVGLTVSGRFTRPGWSETVTDWEALCEREVQHPREEGAVDGSHSILMPADGPGRLVPQSAIIGPDGIEYPVAMSDIAIHLSKEQVRALVGDSCFETIQVPIPDNHPLWRTFRGHPAHVAKWCYEQGDSRLLVVMKDGRCFDPKKWSRDYLMRDEIDALLAGTWEPESQAAYRATGRRPILGGETMPEPVAAECEASEEPEPVAIACQPSEAVERGESVALDSGDGADAPEGASEPVAVITGESGNSDPDLAAMVADLAARVAAIEGLSVQAGAIISAATIEGPEIIATPIAERPRRTAAHERAVRRAWAERTRRRAQSDLDRRALIAGGEYCRTLEAERDAEREAQRDAAKWCNHWKREHDTRAAADRASARIAEEALGEVRALNAALAIARQDVAEASQRAEQFARRGNRHAEARRRSTMLARQRGGQMVALAGLVKRQAAEAAQVKRTMADPTMPERSSDIARLVGERDQARNANAALEQRCARMQSAVDGCAGTIENLASRVAIAEAALRKAA